MRIWYLLLTVWVLIVGSVACALPTTNIVQASEMNVQLGIDYLQNGKTEAAKQHLVLALKQQPQSVMALGAMGYYYEVVGEPDIAKDYYEKSIRLDSHSGIARNNYGTFLCRRGAFRDAIKQFMLALKDKDYLSVAQVYENAGVCALLIPDKALAKFYFDKALRHDAGSAVSIIEVAALSGDDSSELSQEELKSLLTVHTPEAKYRKVKRF